MPGITVTNSKEISSGNYSRGAVRYLAFQNLSGYYNKLNSINTSGEEIDTPNLKRSIATGSADGSSLAEITLARYDVMPLVRYEEAHNWFGIKPTQGR